MQQEQVFCPRCKSTSVLDFESSWRWNGEQWEHRCGDLNPQVGHDVIDIPGAFEALETEVNRLRTALDVVHAFTDERDNWKHDMDGDEDGTWITCDGRWDLQTLVQGALGDEHVGEMFHLASHLRRQIYFSQRTFGPGPRTAGVVDHIRKELTEIEQKPTDLEEWVDVIILAFDGAWRSGATPEQITKAIVAKQTRNEARQWPDWRTVPNDKAIEHKREAPIPTAKCRHCGNDIQLIGEAWDHVGDLKPRHIAEPANAS